MITNRFTVGACAALLLLAHGASAGNAIQPIGGDLSARNDWRLDIPLTPFDDHDGTLRLVGVHISIDLLAGARRITVENPYDHALEQTYFSTYGQIGAGLLGATGSILFTTFSVVSDRYVDLAASDGVEGAGDDFIDFGPRGTTLYLDAETWRFNDLLSSGAPRTLSFFGNIRAFDGPGLDLVETVDDPLLRFLGHFAYVSEPIPAPAAPALAIVAGALAARRRR